MQYNERMASLHLKQFKYQLHYGLGHVALDSAMLEIPTMAVSAEDKQIQILYLLRISRYRSSIC
jgi:hypothetical protein